LRIAFEEELPEMVPWYREHADWVTAIRTGNYLKYHERQYGVCPPRHFPVGRSTSLSSTSTKRTLST
jgi:hypothetical protein